MQLERRGTKCSGPPWEAGVFGSAERNGEQVVVLKGVVPGVLCKDVIGKPASDGKERCRLGRLRNGGVWAIAPELNSLTVMCCMKGLN